MNKRKRKRIFFFSMTVLWIILLSFFSVGRIVKKDSHFSRAENRVLSDAPVFSRETVFSGEYETGFETYVNDQFPFRNQFIHLKMGLDTALGKRESQGVLFGKGKVLMEEFSPYSHDAETKKEEAISKFARQHAKLHQYALIVPTAVNIWKDKLPAGVPVISQNRYMDSLYSFLEAKHIQKIDVRDIFRASKKEELYYHTDHHWTTDGAYQAFLQAASVMGQNPRLVSYDKEYVTSHFCGSLIYKSGFTPNQREKIAIYFPQKGKVHSIINYVAEQQKTATFYHHQSLKSRDAYGVFLNGNHGLIKIQSPVENEKVLLVFKDSYANCFLPFLAPYYSEIVVVDPRYYYESINDLLNTEKVTDVLYLYNANTFFSDTTLTSVLENAEIQK
jgi:hypothetical protein